MQISDETLMAFADGELPPHEAERIEAEVKRDPLLAARVERFRAVRRALKSAYDSVVEEPIPDRLKALLHDVELNEPQKPATVVDINAARSRRFGGPPVWAAIAATLVIGVLAGRWSSPDSLFVTEGGHVRAGSTLSRVLDTRLASAPENSGADLRVGLSFREQGGDYCRTFSGRAMAGLACRENDAWEIRVATATAENGEFRQAGAETLVMDVVDTMIEGEPLDAAQEEQARRRNWRS